VAYQDSPTGIIRSFPTTTLGNGLPLVVISRMASRDGTRMLGCSRISELRRWRCSVGGGGLAQEDDVAVVVSAEQAEGFVVGGPVEVWNAIGFKLGDAMAR
jgi:hypothetical protein